MLRVCAGQSRAHLLNFGLETVNRGVGKRARENTNTPTNTLNTYLRKLESWDQYGGMCVCKRKRFLLHTHIPPY